MNRAFVEYFRCPEHLPVFETQGDQSAEEGYFRFGDAICYGHEAEGAPVPHANGPLPDVWPAATCEGGRVGLPFDLAEVVTNLRQERYRQPPPSTFQRITESAAVHTLYYQLRPALPVGVRKHVQRLRLNRWQDIPFPRWPVEVSVEAAMRGAMALVLKSTGLAEVPFVWFWPEGAPACAMVTHDVEGAAGAKFCGQLMDLDHTFGIRSAFEVVPDAPWDPSRVATRRLVEQLRHGGFEVNVHDLNHDGHLFRDRALFMRRAAEINRWAGEFSSRGFRAGAMYRRQEWFAALEFSYDMSVPNVAHLEPQRGGCCTVMPYFIGDVLELPLTIAQDYSVFHVLGDYSTRLWLEQIACIVEQNGLVSSITHPDYLIEPRARDVYVELLGHLRDLRDQDGLWVAPPAEIDGWWRTRQNLALISDGSGWRIRGPESERARVAYAKLDDDRVTYAVAAA
jgi:hypothetical protein